MALTNYTKELIGQLAEARIDLRILQSNILTELRYASDASKGRWEGMPEVLQKRIDKIDILLAKANKESEVNND